MGVVGRSSRPGVDAMYETVNELFDSKRFDAATLASAGMYETIEMQPRQLHFRETSNRGDYSPYEKSYTTLATFEAFLLESGTGYLVSPALHPGSSCCAYVPGLLCRFEVARTATGRPRAHLRRPCALARAGGTRRARGRPAPRQAPAALGLPESHRFDSSA